MSHVSLEALNALGLLPERCMDCDSRRCVDFACRTPKDPAHGTTGCEACDGECSAEARAAWEKQIESPAAYEARGGRSWEGWMSS